MKAQIRPRVPTGYRGVHAVIEELFPEVRDDVLRVEREMARLLQADNPLLAQLANHLLRGGGKRLRPALVLVAGLSFDYQRDVLVPVAAAVELIHMATLVHDDVVDGASMRRGVDTVNARWGERASVLLGDYLFAIGFSTLAAAGDNRAVRSMADVVFRMSAGEIEQLTGAYDTSRDVESYLQQIDKKTAYFIGACCGLGAMMASAPDGAADAVRRFGYGIGMGFQIVDDILDLVGREDELGKRNGTDLRSGVYTLPVLYALNGSTGAGLKEILNGGGQALSDERVRRAIQLIQASGAVEAAYGVAQRYIGAAKADLDHIPAGPARERLAAIAEFVSARRF